MRELKIGTSWVRGVVGDALTPELIVRFASAFGTWAQGGPVVIGRDTRRSSSMLRAASIAGLLAPGCEVIDLGVCPTPAISFAVRELGAAGGLSITGGHNDARWNALKFIGPDGALLNDARSEELHDIYHASAFRAAPPRSPRPVVEAPEVFERYLEHLLAALDAEPIRKRRFRVALDFCNGACAALAGRFLAELGCELLPLNEKAAGHFAHEPTPNLANMSQLVGIMGYLRADLGAAMNVDGDRVAFVTAGGRALSEEHTLPLAAEARLARRPGPVVTNLSTSRMVDLVAASYGQPVIRTSVGEGLVMDRGLEEGAALAGEGNGGIGVLPASMTFDALLTLGLVLEGMATRDEDPAAVAARLPRLAMRKGVVPCSPDQVYKRLESFRSAYAARAPSFQDGVRVEWPDAWLHVRASNTEPLLRIIVEAESEGRAAAVYEEALALSRRAELGRTEA